ncbi:UNVERIFIED_CONTAM: Coatomer subunit delta-1 [Sesamum angustifolium]|uniref:Coatomer subunit delta n=1 Tax=Sesamum angustifolium TaxID=2727405 RepID=A0AAW2QBB0_9LAMI
MVVLAASIISKSGKALVSRQFVDMSRIRIEGYLAAFPKLVGTGKQHTYVETENVRYVYQPIESLFLLLVTNKQSNILDDLDTLRLLSRLVPEYSYSLDEEGIGKSAFEILFAFDEVISLGHKENVTVAQVKQYCEMESHEEKLHKLVLQSKINETKEAMIRKASEIDKSKIEKNRGEKGGFMSLQSTGSGTGFGSETSISSSGGGFGSGSGPVFEVESFSSKSKGRPAASASAPPKGLGMQLGKTQKTNQFLESLKAEGEVIVEDVRPSIGHSKAADPPPCDPVTLTVEEKLNVTLKQDGGIGNFDLQGSLSLQILNQDDGFIQVQDPNRPFPTGQAGDGISLLKWRMQSADESLVPLSINCWPSVSGKPMYDSRKSVLEWSIVLIDNSNRSGSMEFVIPADTSELFPISVGFTSTSTFSNLKVANILPVRGGNPPKFSQRTSLSTENYQVV